MTLRDAVAAELSRRQWSQSELGRQSGVAQNTINQWLNGKNSINSDLLDKILAALKMPKKW